MTKIIAGLMLFTAASFAAVDVVPPGTDIHIRTAETITRSRADGRVFRGTVAEDVLDRSGNLAIPRGADAELIVRNLGNEMVIDLDSISVYGRRYAVAANDVSRNEKEGLGANRRTGKYVGGGAVLGTILGAIAGGGRGAAIGAASGAAAGAGGEVLTRGRALRIPAESVLHFQLARQLAVSTAGDNGYTRNGQHYHRYPAQPRYSDQRQ